MYGDWLCVDVGNDLFKFLSIETRSFKPSDVLKVYYNEENHILLINKDLPLDLYHFKLILDNFPGTYSEITDIFSYFGINIIDSDSTALSGQNSVLEYTVESEETSEVVEEIRDNINATELIRGELIEYYVNPLFLYVFSKGNRDVELANEETSNVQIENSILKLNTEACTKLGLQRDKNYIALVCVYVKVPLIIIHFLEDNPRYRFLKMDLKNTPGVLAAILKVIRNRCDIISSKLKCCDKCRARFFVALELLEASSEEEIAEKDQILNYELKELVGPDGGKIITSEIEDMKLSEIGVDIRDTNREVREAIERYKKCVHVKLPEDKDINELNQIIEDLNLSMKEIQEMKEKLVNHKRIIQKT